MYDVCKPEIMRELVQSDADSYNLFTKLFEIHSYV
jgi:hypothetical protein